MRIWLSGPRLFNGLVRSGVSFGREDLQRLRGRNARLPTWRRHELRAGLQKSAGERHEKLTKEDADYLIDKALATGLLDADGNLNFTARGDRTEMADQILAAATTWGKPMTREQAEATADAAIAEPKNPRFDAWALLAGVFVALCAGVGAAVFMVSLFR